MYVYRSLHELSRSQKRFVQTIIGYFTGCNMILDAGSGSGWVGDALKDSLSATLTSVDIKSELLKGNSSRYTYAAAMDVRHLGFSEAFDLILAKDIIEHMVNPAAAMEQFRQALKENGKIFITVPSPQAPYFWDDYTHIRPFTKASLSHLLMESGFEILHMHYLARPTIGASLLRLKGAFDALAEHGFRRGDLMAIAQKNSMLRQNLHVMSPISTL
ncbi:MAG: class I SAM-dependent methyltransferase [Candidatus Bathyarchaeota archaeon]|nr:class I SAM-dependent methyltransferase [Candidatus Bathyarchaeota archaeon]